MDERVTFRGAAGRRGFTLIEAVMAAGVTGVLLASIGSVVSLCARSMPERGSDGAIVASEVQDGLSMMGDDLSGATSVVSAGAADLSFRVLDPSAASKVRVVRYWWDGTKGTPLRRTWDGAGEIAVSPALSRLSMSYDWRTVAISTSAGTALGSSTGLAHCLNASGSTFTVGLLPRIAQVVKPRLDASATAWQPTRVRAKVTLTGGLLTSLYAKIYQGDSSNLGSQTLLATSVSVAALSGASAGWMDFTFTGAPEIASGQSISIVLGSVVSLGGALVTYSSSGIADSLACCATSSNGSSWSVMTDGAVAYELYGQVRTPVAAAGSESRLAGLMVDLVPMGTGVPAARARVRTPAWPKVE